ncbi:MAG: hypothetical protein WCI77_00175 [Candidatus Omnitrophota bacterium]
MRNSKLFFLVLFFFCVIPEAFSFQFQDYTWGIPWAEVRDKINKEKKDTLESTYTLSYSEEALGYDAVVTFVFTPGGKLLASVSIEWKTPAVAQVIKDRLTKEYGEPTKNPYTEEYTWQGASDAESLFLDCDAHETELYYYGGKYYTQFQREIANVIAAQKGYPQPEEKHSPPLKIDIQGGNNWRR